MGMIFKVYLSGAKIWSCEHCAAHLASHDDIVSKQFHGRQGRAYLFNSVVNVTLGEQDKRDLLTGMHVVADIYCNVCNNILGWKYLQAEDVDQKYKEGKFIIERAKVVKDTAWK